MRWRRAALLAALGTAVALLAPARPAAIARDEATRLFSEANDAYAAGKYEDAAAGYRRLLVEGNRSEAVHYNLGNALFKMNRLGPAILEYERAARLAPQDPDVLDNLSFARSLTADKPSEAGARTTTFFMERLTELSSLDQDAVIFTVFYLLAGGMVTLLIVARSALWRRAALWSLALIAVPLALSGLSVCWKAYRAASIEQAIVLRERVDVVSGPADDTTTLFTVHEGLKVIVRERQGAWARVSLDNGLSGWVPGEAMESI